MVSKCSQFLWSLQRIPFTGHRTLFHASLSIEDEEAFRNNWKILNLQMINNYKVNTVRVLLFNTQNNFLIFSRFKNYVHYIVAKALVFSYFGSFIKTPQKDLSNNEVK